MLPEGREATPKYVLMMVETGRVTRGVVYRHDSGKIYFFGLKKDRLLWREAGFRYMGSVEFLRDRFEAAKKTGVRKKSLVWYLLTDVERELGKF